MNIAALSVGIVSHAGVRNRSRDSQIPAVRPTNWPSVAGYGVERVFMETGPGSATTLTMGDEIINARSRYVHGHFRTSNTFIGDDEVISMSHPALGNWWTVAKGATTSRVGIGIRKHILMLNRYNHVGAAVPRYGSATTFWELV